MSDQQIHLDDLACTGFESQLIMCATNRSIGTHDCVHQQDVALSCVIRKCEHAYKAILQSTCSGLKCKNSHSVKGQLSP